MDRDPAIEIFKVLSDYFRWFVHGGDWEDLFTDILP